MDIRPSQAFEADSAAVVLELSAVTHVESEQGGSLRLSLGAPDLSRGVPWYPVHICDFRPETLRAAAAFDSAVVLNEVTASLRFNLQHAINAAAYIVIRGGLGSEAGSMIVSLFPVDRVPSGAFVVRCGLIGQTYLREAGVWAVVSEFDVTAPETEQPHRRTLVAALAEPGNPVSLVIPADDLAHTAGLRTDHARSLGYFETSE